MKSSEKEYLEKCQNGARVLFEVENYRMLDGMQDETESYFILYFFDDEETPVFYEITLTEMYNLIAMKICGNVSDDIIVNEILRLTA